jgi:hypothetical protein
MPRIAGEVARFWSNCYPADSLEKTAWYVLFEVCGFGTLRLGDGWVDALFYRIPGAIPLPGRERDVSEGEPIADAHHGVANA